VTSLGEDVEAVDKIRESISDKSRWIVWFSTLRNPMESFRKTAALDEKTQRATMWKLWLTSIALSLAVVTPIYALLGLQSQLEGQWVVIQWMVALMGAAILRLNSTVTTWTLRAFNIASSETHLRTAFSIAGSIALPFLMALSIPLVSRIYQTVLSAPHDAVRVISLMLLEPSFIGTPWAKIDLATRPLLLFSVVAFGFIATELASEKQYERLIRRLLAALVASELIAAVALVVCLATVLSNLHITYGGSP